jgi:hypothetical protein
VIVDEERVQQGWVLKRARVLVWVLGLRSRDQALGLRVLVLVE